MAVINICIWAIIDEFWFHIDVVIDLLCDEMMIGLSAISSWAEI